MLLHQLLIIQNIALYYTTYLFYSVFILVCFCMFCFLQMVKYKDGQSKVNLFFMCAFKRSVWNTKHLKVCSSWIYFLFFINSPLVLPVCVTVVVRESQLNWLLVSPSWWLLWHTAWHTLNGVWMQMLTFCCIKDNLLGRWSTIFGVLTHCSVSIW